MKVLLSLTLPFLMFATSHAQDVMLLSNGTTLTCDILSYSNGVLRVQRSDGVVLSGQISKIKTIQFMEHPKAVEKQYDTVEVNVTLKGICETPEQRDELARFAQDAFADIVRRKITSIELLYCRPGNTPPEIIVNFEPRQIVDSNSRFGDIFEEPYAIDLFQNLNMEGERPREPHEEARVIC